MFGLYGHRNADSILDAGYIADMTDVILTGLLTLAGALGGVWLSQRYAAETSTQTLVEARRSVVRAELSTLIAEVRAHLESATLFMMLIGKGTDQDLMEFVNTDSGREAQRRTAAIYRSLAGLTVTVGDPPVLNALVELEECINDWADKANGPVFAAKSRGGDIVDAIVKGNEHVRKTRAALADVIRASAPLVRIPIDLERKPPWWVALRRKSRS